MPGINVSSLNGGDLRRLLKVAQARKDGLLADRLEWEIASRATRLVRPAAAFATLPDEDYEELAEGATAPEAEAIAPRRSARKPASGRRRAGLVTLTAILGSLLSATVFWGLQRMDRLPSLIEEKPHPTRAMAMRPSPPATDQVVVAIAPEPVLRGPQPLAPEAPPVAPAETPAAEVAKQAAPARPMIAKAEATSTKEPAPIRRTAAKTEIAAKKAPTRKDPALKKEPVLRTQPLAKAEGKPRPPTLDEWLANSEPTSR